MSALVRQSQGGASGVRGQGQASAYHCQPLVLDLRVRGKIAERVLILFSRGARGPPRDMSFERILLRFRPMRSRVNDGPGHGFARQMMTRIS